MTDLSLAAEFDDVSRDQWLALVDKVLKGGDFEKRLVSSTDDGLRVEPLYTRDVAKDSANNAVPGQVPYTRGFSGNQDATGWDIRQVHGSKDPQAVNGAILTDLAGGVSSILLRCQAPGQAGLPTTPEAMVAALKDVDLSICPIALQAGENFGAASAYLLGAWASRKIAPEARRGAFNADPIGTLAVNGGLAQPLDQAIAGSAALVAKTQDLPKVTALIADGRPYHDAGASEAQGLAAMLATLVAYLRGCENAGISPAQSLPKIALGLAADTDQFLTIAKLRAARVLVARVAGTVDAQNEAAQIEMVVTTSLRMMAKRDPWVNMLRATIACAGAAMGGANAMTVLPFTAALGEPDEFARRIARNTQIILQEESALGRVADPAGGAWYVEKLTDDLARRSWQLFQKIEANGGIAGALDNGMVQDMIARTAYEREQDLARGKRALTGVSAFARLGDDGVNTAPFDTPQPVDDSGAKAKALQPRRLAEPFERLRDAADAFGASSGAPPRVFLANLGSSADFSARASWAKNFFAAGGIETISNDGFTNAADVGAAFAAGEADAACLCSSDEVYSELGEAVSCLLKTAGAKAVYVAGRGGVHESELRAAGVDEFLYAGCDALEALADVHKLLGVGR